MPDRSGHPDDNPDDLGKIYSEDGYCVACGNGHWKHHMPECQIADLIDALRDATATIRRERLYEGAPIAEEDRILAVLDAALAQIDPGAATRMDPEAAREIIEAPHVPWPEGTTVVHEIGRGSSDG